MTTTTKPIDQYISSLPAERQEVMEQLRKIIKKNLPKGFTEEMNYGMIAYVVPHTLYPAGYHCKPSDPLPFMNIASKKNFISVYHMGLYADEKLMKWFTTEYPKHSTSKLDMVKSCIRFKKPDQIPMKLIGELASKMTAKQWIELYEKNIKK